MEVFKGLADLQGTFRNVMFQELLENVPLLSRTFPGNVSRTFPDGHNLEFFKGLGEVIWQTFRGSCVSA